MKQPPLDRFLAYYAIEPHHWLGPMPQFVDCRSGATSCSGTVKNSLGPFQILVSPSGAALVFPRSGLTQDELVKGDLIGRCQTYSQGGDGLEEAVCMM